MVLNSENPVTDAETRSDHDETIFFHRNGQKVWVGGLKPPERRAPFDFSRALRKQGQHATRDIYKGG